MSCQIAAIVLITAGSN